METLEGISCLQLSSLLQSLALLFFCTIVVVVVVVAVSVGARVGFV